MTRREAARLLLVGVGGMTVITGCGGGITKGENVLSTIPTLDVVVRLNQTAERTVRIRQGRTVVAVIRRAFPDYHREGGLTVINGVRGHWRYAVNGIEPRVYAGNYRLTSNCRLDLRLL